MRDFSLTFPKEVRSGGTESLTIHMVRPGRDSTEVTRSRPGRDSYIHMCEGFLAHLPKEVRDVVTPHYSYGEGELAERPPSTRPRLRGRGEVALSGLARPKESV